MAFFFRTTDRRLLFQAVFSLAVVVVLAGTATGLYFRIKSLTPTPVVLGTEIFDSSATPSSLLK